MDWSNITFFARSQRQRENGYCKLFLLPFCLFFKLTGKVNIIANRFERIML